jgi:predicted HTH transcriptional regulator
MDYNKNLGINASPQFEFRLSVSGLKEIYKLAGPLCDSHKDKCVKFHINRSKNYKNKGRKCVPGKTKQKILNMLKTNNNMTTTEMQFEANIGNDVILHHLHDLERKGKIHKERKGKRYIWNYNAN